ncbi:MAG: hypothetical protein H7Y00_15545 [Fimbriimonadaceae bacterium]|nr:hypothetical protein [Chitinophagales bacterium]
MKKILIILVFLIHINVEAQIAYTKAKSLANETIDAMGGLDGFASTKYIGWNFFGSRRLIWDKENNRVRVDYLKKQLTIITYLHKDEGALFINGLEVMQPDSLKKYFDKARRVWMNDSYWLIMPFKLFDSGVNLSYIGEEKSTLGTNCEVIQMAFNNVGATPENKYMIYINKETKLVDEWKYFAKFEDENPEIINTWSDYKKYENILLSSDRGVEGKLTEINVWKSLPEYIFLEKEIPPFDQLGK